MKIIGIFLIITGLFAFSFGSVATESIQNAVDNRIEILNNI